MLLPPLAAVYPGQPEAAYLAAFALDFIDAPGARDMAASLVAGLAAVLGESLDGATLEARWAKLLTTMRDVDPYGYAEVPFAGRPLHKWMDRAQEFAHRAHGRPGRLFQLLEEEGQPTYWWDAHFTLLVPLAMLEFCSYEPLAAMHLTLDFRHDTDSYAQVLGCLAGAVCGVDVFPLEMRRTVVQRLSVDYGEDMDEWQTLLLSAAGMQQAGSAVVR
jgi:hypothetical protein